MVISVPGEFYVFETEEEPSREDFDELFRDLNENDILEVRLYSEGTDKEPRIYHVNKVILPFLDSHINLQEKKSADVFRQVAEHYNYNIPIPVMDEEGNCVSILKKIWTYYDHPYCYEGGLDMTFLDRYDTMLLMGLNEYSVEIYRRVLPCWKGREVLLFGKDWRDYLDLLPEPGNVRVRVFEEQEEAERAVASLQNAKLLCVVENLPRNEGPERYKNGVLCYDEVMTLTFMFSRVIHQGTLNPDKKFFVIDGYFRIEGIFGIWHKVFTAARYAKAKGYIPVFQIVSSNENIYSDFAGDDIWNKFFQQPEHNSIQKLQGSSYIVLSPNMNILNIMRYIFDEVSKDTQLVWAEGIFNKAVKDYIRERQRRFLPHPESTLGILLRGTDYKNPLPGHGSHATMEMVIQKVDEVRDSWGFEWIYLATEDEEICEKMKAHYGDQITFTDQERYSVEPGQLLVDVHREKKPGNGFRLGAEYLCSVNLLAQCSSLIASGSCGALGEAMRENDGKYKNVFVF